MSAPPNEAGGFLPGAIYMSPLRGRACRNACNYRRLNPDDEFLRRTSEKTWVHNKRPWVLGLRSLPQRPKPRPKTKVRRLTTCVVRRRATVSLDRSSFSLLLFAECCLGWLSSGETAMASLCLAASCRCLVFPGFPSWSISPLPNCERLSSFLIN
jgi:hypothetical protein